MQDAYLYYLLACAGGRVSCEAGGRALAAGRALVFCRSIATARRLHDLLSLLLLPSSSSASAKQAAASAARGSRNSTTTAPAPGSAATNASLLTWAAAASSKSSSAGTGIGATRVQLLHARMQQRQRLKNLERFQGLARALVFHRK